MNERLKEGVKEFFKYFKFSITFLVPSFCLTFRHFLMQLVIFKVIFDNTFRSTSNIDPDSELHWIKKVDMAFKLFDKNKDGLISRKEFGWMIHSDKVNKKQIENMFRVRMNLTGVNVRHVGGVEEPNI